MKKLVLAGAFFVVILTYLYMAMPVTWNRSPIVVAVSDNNVAALRKYIDDGGDVNARSKLRIGNKGGEVPLLFHATRANATECVELLLNSGADVRWPSAFGHAGLEAVYQDNRAIVELLIRYGLDVQVPVSFATESLFLEAVACEKWSALAGMLPVVGTQMDRGGLIEHCQFSFFDADCDEAVGMMIEQGLSPDTRIASGETLLIAAIRLGDIQLAKVLLKRGADPAWPNREGVLPLDFIKGSSSLDRAFVTLLNEYTRNSAP